MASFPTDAEADLVDALRSDGAAEISLVATKEKQLVGHVMFSKMGAPFKALALAPISVHPDFRKNAIAAQLIQAGLEVAKTNGWQGIFVLGDPQYYQRFGFSADMAANFLSPYSGPYLMALSLHEETLPERSGILEYAHAFSELD